MAAKSERLVLNGEQYIMTQLGAVEGLGLFHDLRALSMPFLRELVTSADILKAVGGDNPVAVENLPPETMAKFAGLVFQLFEAMPKQLELELTRSFAANGTVLVGQAPMPLGDSRQTNSVFDQHFAGAYVRYQSWLLANIKFNFLGFLDSSAASANGPAAATP